MAASPQDYEWLSTTNVAEAGCITVVVEADDTRVRDAFGADTATLPGSGADLLGEWPAHLELGVEWAWFSTSGAASVVVEDNNFQGSRSEVLRVASRASATGKAASIFWNVNGLVIFTCARRGKVIGTVDLSIVDESDLEGLPRSLHKLALLCEDIDVDPVAVGAAMVEKFTGAAFGRRVFAAGSAHALTPVPSDLDTFTVKHPPFGLREQPQLVAAIAAMDAADQRAFAEFAARAAVEEAGLAGEPGVLAMLAQYGTGEPAKLDPRIEALRADVARRASQLEGEEMDRETYGGLELTFAYQKNAALQAVRQSTHPDPLSGALGCAENAIGASTSSRTERGITFIENDTGRWRGESVNSAAWRGTEYVRVLTQAATSEPAQWDTLRATLPTPFTGDERAAIVTRDRKQEADGEFSTYQMGPAGSPDDWDE